MRGMGTWGHGDGGHGDMGETWGHGDGGHVRTWGRHGDMVGTQGQAVVWAQGWGDMGCLLGLGTGGLVVSHGDRDRGMW